MSQQVYKDMLSVMKKRRGPFAGMDIPEFYEMIEALFTPEEAEVNNVLTTKPTTAADIAKEMSKGEDQITAILETMADNGLCHTFINDEIRYYRGVPFMPGIFEYKFMPGRVTEEDKNIARLIYAYKLAYEAAKGETKMTFPTTRVIPVDRTIVFQFGIPAAI